MIEIVEVGPRDGLQNEAALVSLADTIGVAAPADVTRLVTRVADAIAPIPVRAHFHNTRGTGIANVWAVVQALGGVMGKALPSMVARAPAFAA